MVNTQIMAKLSKELGTTFDPNAPVDEYKQAQALAAAYNDREGDENKKDGYNCELCKNKGKRDEVIQRPDGHWTTQTRICKCVAVRRCIRQMKKSGLKKIEDYTFEKYEATEPWQKAIKNAAMNYAKDPKGWFFLGGQSGAGKTHLCTAICKSFLDEGRAVVYMRWRERMAELKDYSRDPAERMALLNELKKAEVLYIDDLFKTGKNKDGVVERPTAADVGTMYEIISDRYEAKLPTIISSELTEDELLEIDEATGGRILEEAQTFSINREPSRNYRTKKAVSL